MIISNTHTTSVASNKLPKTSESHSTMAIVRRINAIKTADKKRISDTTFDF